MDKKAFFRKACIPAAIVLLAVLGVALLASCSSNASSSSATSNVGVVTTVTVTDKIETSGNLDASQLAKLTWGTRGTVAQVNVKKGQTVKAGDVLAELNASSVPAEVVTAQSDLASAQRALEILQTSTSARAAAEQAVADAQKTVSTAQSKVESLGYPRASDAVVQNAYAKIRLDQKKLAQAQDTYRYYVHKRDKDPDKAQALYNMTNLQITVNDDIATYNWYTGKPTDLEAQQYRAALSVAQATLADDQRTLDNLKDGTDPVDLAAAQAKVTSAQETANLMKIIAPFDGEIIAVMANTGDPISSGDKALEMVNRSTLKVDALVDEAEISSVSTGNAADVTLDTLPDIILKGKTSLIDPIGSTVNGLVKYTVTILLEPTKQNLLFGSTANVVLYTSDPHSMLAVPLAAVQTDTQGEYVTVVKADGTTARVTITSGDLSGTLVTITTSGDLKEGDQVQLASSSSSSTSTSSSSSNNIMPDAGGGPGGPGGG